MNLETVSYWQSKLRGSKFKNVSEGAKLTTKSLYISHLWFFNRWLVKNTFSINQTRPLSENTFEQVQIESSFKSVEELVKILSNPLSIQSDVIKIIKKYLTDPIHEGKKTISINNAKCAILSYFEKNELPLIFKFDPKTQYDYEEEIEDPELTIPEFMKMLTVGKPSVTENAVFLCTFHRGLDASTLVDRFNYEAWEQMAKWFGSENHNSWDLDKCPVPIKLTRIKTGYMHTGFLERDAVEALQKYLDYRYKKTGKDMGSDQPMFLNKYNRPITTKWVSGKFSNLAQRACVQKLIGRKSWKYRIESHEVRDLLKSTLIDSGCRMDVADHVIGHKPKDSYEKQAKLYPETLRKEYAKASQRLNIFTKFASITSGKDDADELKLELREKISEIGRLKEDILTELAIKKKEEIFAEKQSEMLRQMQRQIDELSGKSSGNTSKSVEFCCISCSTVHDRQECPACGSKLERIYESGTKKA